jgi:hypothetical protein
MLVFASWTMHFQMPFSLPPGDNPIAVNKILLLLLLNHDEGKTNEMHFQIKPYI